MFDNFRFAGFFHRCQTHHTILFPARKQKGGPQKICDGIFRALAGLVEISLE
ncbi:hypothetical protein HMPREF0239_01200 [Clostridium sp. ATCC BAA-442]|nr:hypothetical protein HMPREF0239_01200 [Clostridium sp. ATCC BAA-442]